MTMNRRTVLKVLSGAAAGGVLGRNRSAWGQAPPRSVADPRGGASGPNTKDVRIGMSAAFKGSAAGLGIELYRGALAYYTEINQRHVDVPINPAYKGELAGPVTVQYVETFDDGNHVIAETQAVLR